MKEKVFLRREIRTKLRAQNPELRAVRSLQIQKQLSKLLEEESKKNHWSELAVFLAQPTEPNLDRWIAALQNQQFLVYAPHMESGPQPFRVLAPDWSNVRANTLGWREPQEQAECELKAASEADAIFLPGLAFDRKGTRLGQGAGWYDQVLETLPSGVFRVGVCFDFQVVKELPQAEHDEPVDAVVTEKRVIYV